MVWKVWKREFVARGVDGEKVVVFHGDKADKIKVFPIRWNMIEKRQVYLPTDTYIVNSCKHFKQYILANKLEDNKGVYAGSTKHSYWEVLK